MDFARVPRRTVAVVLLGLAVALGRASLAPAQQPTSISPSHAYVVSGYGTAGALYTQDGERTLAG